MCHDLDPRSYLPRHITLQQDPLGKKACGAVLVFQGLLLLCLDIDQYPLYTLVHSLYIDILGANISIQSCMLQVMT